jgi:hypothetical protein
MTATCAALSTTEMPTTRLKIGAKNKIMPNSVDTNFDQLKI